MVDIFDEVDEDVRRDRLIELWKKYQNHLLGAAVAIVAATAGIVAWRDYERKQAEAQAAELAAAAELAGQGETDRALAAFAKIARDGKAGYATLARLNEAGLKARARDAAGSAASYQAIAADSGVPQELRDLAAYMAVLESAGTASPEELERQATALSAADSPWRAPALELAAAAALRAGNTAKAREIFARIADDQNAPAALRGRAAEMLAALGT